MAEDDVVIHINDDHNEQESGMEQAQQMQMIVQHTEAILEEDAYDDESTKAGDPTVDILNIISLNHEDQTTANQIENVQDVTSQTANFVLNGVLNQVIAKPDDNNMDNGIFSPIK